MSKMAWEAVKELTDLNPDFFAGKELLMNLTMESLKEHEHSAWVYYMKVKKVMDFRKLEE